VVLVFVALSRFVSHVCQLCGTCANQWQLHPDLHVVTSQRIGKKIKLLHLFAFSDKGETDGWHKNANITQDIFLPIMWNSNPLFACHFFSLSSDGRQPTAKLPFAAGPFTQQNKIPTRRHFLTAVFNNIRTSWCLTPCSLIEVLSVLRKAMSKPSGYKRLTVPPAADSSFNGMTYTYLTERYHNSEELILIYLRKSAVYCT
jgi:hypothetical protein